MTHELLVLVAAAASIGFVHTLLGPDHYLPFIVMAKARGWTRRKALSVTALCGLGHVLSSTVFGAVGLALAMTAGSVRAIATACEEIGQPGR